ncbi:uncharacterized protein TNCV_5015511 [Trichonephila clavipes]|nr:uncharacterized protein TNCV_5015511 [Trichonephila clavipes]
MSAGTGEYFPPLQFTCRYCGGGDRGRVAIYRPFGEFRRAKSYCHLYGRSRPTTGVPLAHATMNFFEGRMDLDLPMPELRRLRSQVDHSRLSVWVEVGERFLNQIEIGFAQSLLYKSDLRLVFLGANPQVFKPSMPFKCYVSISFHDGSPLPSWRLNDQKLEFLTRVKFAGGGEQELQPRYEQMSPVQFGVWEITVDLLSVFGSLTALNDVQSMLLEVIGFIDLL